MATSSNESARSGVRPITSESTPEALGARESAGFARFIAAVTSPLLAPFQGLLRDPSVGGSQFMMSHVVALVVYALLHAAINGALRMVAHRKTEI